MKKIEARNIETRKDIEFLVDTFYQRVRKDDLIGPIFNEVIGKHWGEHLQKLYDFWESRLFDKELYQGKPLMVHKPLPIDARHFDRWLNIWHETLDDYFIGNKADEAKARAIQIGAFFLEKITEMRQNENQKKN